VQDLNGAYLKALEPDRMLAFYRERAGLRPRANPYGGWDGGGRNLTGHIAGHYLSAISLMWAATGDAMFKSRADYLVDEFDAIQKAHGDGYLGAVEGLRRAFARLARGEIDSQSFDLNGLWSPWYTLHKTFAGLRDAWRYAGNRRALQLEIGFAEWAESVLAGLDHSQLQHMMNTEFGGMNEVLVDLYRDTRDERWLALSWKFEHDDFLAPLRQGIDNLDEKHGNTAIPKLLGSADRYTVTGDATDLLAAAFFWGAVTGQHSFATGGHGKDEYFGPPGRFGARVDGRTAETCNVYNMLKLTRRLFTLWQHPRFADFHERALFNHILASMDPEDGSTCYMVPVGRGVQREYQDMFESFTCCVGTGMESHALHGSGIYFETEGRLFVNLYAPSTVSWAEAGAILTMATDFPLGETANIRFDLELPRRLTVSLRRPSWAGPGFAVRVNGMPFDPDETLDDTWCDERSQYRDQCRDRLSGSSAFVDITRRWESGDVVEVLLPKTLRLEPTPDDPRRAAILWGPLVLAGDLGPAPRRAPGLEDAGAVPPPVPVLVAAEMPVESWLKPVDLSRGVFRIAGVARLPTADDEATEVELKPFHRLHRRTYAVYWDLFTESEWQDQKRFFAAEAEWRRQLEAATIAFIEPGETYSERDFNYRGGDDATAYRIEGRPSRRSRTWFAYDVPVDADDTLLLILDLYSDDRRHSPADFSILVDGQELAEYELRRSEPPRFFDVRFAVPSSFVHGKTRATIRFEARPGSQIPAILGVRLARKSVVDPE
jgi:hypothetical protein